MHDISHSHEGAGRHPAPEQKGGTCCCCNGRRDDLQGEPAADDSPPDDFTAHGCGPDGAPLDDAPAVSYPLASVAMSNGGTIEFEVVEERRGEVAIATRELGHAERLMPSVLAIMARRSVPEIYAALCPGKDMPKAIDALRGSKDSDGENGGDLVESVEEPIEADLDDLGIETDVQLGSSGDGGYGGHFCVPGDGWYAFRNFTCYGSYPSNAWTWCDPSVAYYWRDRWTTGPYKRRNSFGVTATCGSPAETRHYRQRLNGKWKRMKTWYLPNNYWQWTRYDGTFRYNRWVRHLSSIQGPPSFVRSFTAIFD